jgi:uncharacterized protein (DUF924 family)
MNFSTNRKAAYEELAQIHQSVAATMHRAAEADMHYALTHKDGRSRAKFRRAACRDQLIGAKYTALAMQFLASAMEIK